MVKQAVDVVSDPVCRARYDETGEIGGDGPDNSWSEAAQMIAIALERVLAKLEGESRLPEFAPLLAECDAVLREQREVYRKQEAALLVRQGSLKRVAGRFTRRAGDGDNLLERIVAWRADEVVRSLTRCRAEIARVDAALKLLAEYRFEVVPKAQVLGAAPGIGMWTFMQYGA